MVETALSAGTPEGLVIVVESAPNNLPAPIIPKLAAPETLRKSRLDQLRPSMFTAGEFASLLLPMATIDLFSVQVCWIDYGRFSFYAF